MRRGVEAWRPNGNSRNGVRHRTMANRFFRCFACLQRRRKHSRHCTVQNVRSSQGGSVACLKLSACTRRMSFDPLIVRVRVSLADISLVEAGAQYNQQSALQAAHLNPVSVAVRAAAVAARSASRALCGSLGLSACPTRRLRRLRFGLLPLRNLVVVVPRLRPGPRCLALAPRRIANTVGRGAETILDSICETARSNGPPLSLRPSDSLSPC